MRKQHKPFNKQKMSWIAHLFSDLTNTLSCVGPGIDAYKNSKKRK
jgi:hypothetical protein